MKLNLDDDNVELVQTTVEQVRSDGDDCSNLQAEIDTALDISQARVFGGNFAKAYVVIEISK